MTGAGPLRVRRVSIHAAVARQRDFMQMRLFRSLARLSFTIIGSARISPFLPFFFSLLLYLRFDSLFAYSQFISL